MLLLVLCYNHSFLYSQTFQERIQSPLLVGGDEGDISFADVDGDQDLDVLITGFDQLNYNGGGLATTTKLYLNDGSGNYTQSEQTSFVGVVTSSTAFADVDGDQDPDVLITGSTSSFESIAHLYLNDGAGKFTLATGTPFTAVSYSSVDFFDIDNDQDQDVLITGYDTQGEESSTLYLNDGLGNFTKKTNTPFEPVSEGSIAIADIDNDNDLDVFFQPNGKLYTNDGTGNFAEAQGTNFELFWDGSAAFADVDGDQDQDLFVTGIEDDEYFTKASVLLNDGNGHFSKKKETDIVGVSNSSIAFADVDGDQDPDLLISGFDTSFTMITRLYINDGFGNFSPTIHSSFPGIANGKVAFADVDGDSDQDLMIAGADSTQNELVKLYINQDIILSVSEREPQQRLEVSIYSNPIKGNNLFVLCNFHINAQASFKLFNLNGSLIREKTAYFNKGENSLTMDVSTLPSGNYFLEVIQGSQKGIAKVIIQR